MLGGPCDRVTILRGKASQMNIHVNAPVTKLTSRGATVCSLFMAFLGANVVVYVVEVVHMSIRASYYGPFFIFVFIPFIAAFVTVPIYLAVTLLAWACFVLGHRWVRNSDGWANVVAVALTAVICSAFYLVVGLLYLPLLDPYLSLAFGIALAVIITICVAGGVGRRWEARVDPAPADHSSST